MDSESPRGAHLILRCAPPGVSPPGATPDGPRFRHPVLPLTFRRGQRETERDTDRQQTFERVHRSTGLELRGWSVGFRVEGSGVAVN